MTTTPEREFPHDYHDVWQGELDGTDEAAIKEVRATSERGVEEVKAAIVNILAYQATITAQGENYTGEKDWALNKLTELLHHQLQKAREEERERCIQAIKNPLTDWECIADLEDGDAHNHKTITVCRAVASINNIFKE